MEQFADMKNREFAFACIETLIKRGKLTENALTVLTDPVQCREKFHCRFAILMEVPPESTDEELTGLCCIHGKRRYYQRRFAAGDRAFVITNHWYGAGQSMPDNRTPFVRWVKAICDA